MSKSVHGDRYSYEKSKYINKNTPIEIICSKHGPFFQLPNVHIKGSGCPECGRQSRYEKRKSNKEEFIEKSIKVHGYVYNYDKVEYRSAKDKVIITCNKHGDFEQSPNTHLKGHGCAECKNLKRPNTEEFISLSRKAHGDTYIYDKTSYVNMKTKVVITCKKHGDFEQTPDNHLRGKNGCPKCNKSHGELRVESFLKKNNIRYTYQKKFEDCRNKLPLSFDFYLEDLHICIEYDGEQHYIPHFKTKFEPDKEKQLNKAKTNDAIKDKYCKDNNIRLIRIPYWEKDKIYQILFRRIILSNNGHKSKELLEKLKK